MLSHQFAEERKQNRANLLHILKAIRFLARQGLPLRGTSLTNEVDGNFWRLLHLFCDFDAALPTWLKKKTDRYTSAELQNELLQVMALRVLRDISGNVQDRPFTVMVDETTDASTQEQVVIVLRWVDDNLDPHEDFIGLHITASTNASSILAIIKDVLLCMNVSLSNCRGQCYDGAAVMSGCRGGVATQLAQEEPRALYTHCYGHSLNLACQDTIRDIKPLQVALDTVFELSKLLKYSAKRKAEFKQIQAQMAPEDPGFRTLCPTRWTVRASSLQSIIQNYSVIQCSLESFADMAKRDPEMSARCTGVASQFQSFEFFFGVALGEKVICLADNLSKSLQHKKMSAAQGQALAALTIETFKAMRSDEKFSGFWKELMEKHEEINVSDPTLPRRRKVPSRYEVGEGTGHFPTSVDDHYRPIYFAAIDVIMQCISSRFDQPGYKTYSKLEAVLLKGVTGKSYAEELSFITELYSNDINMCLLQT